MKLRVEARVDRPGFRLEAEFGSETMRTVLFGPSGSGKSTTLDLIDGSLPPGASRVELDGTRLDALPSHRRGTPRVFQDGRLFPHLDVATNLRYGHRPGRGPGFDDVVASLEIQELLARRPDALSGGQRQRVAVGRALLAAPRLLLLDEPLASLDRALRQRILPHLRRWGEEFDVPLLYVTHDVEEALRLGGTGVRIESGQVTGCGPIEELLAHPPVPGPPALSGDDTVFRGEVEGPTDDPGLMACRVGRGRLLVPGSRGEGDTVLIAVSARDVMLSGDRPDGLSARNQLAVRVDALRRGSGGPWVDLRWLDAPDASPHLRARVTETAIASLGLREGWEGYAVVKSAALRVL